MIYPQIYKAEKVKKHRVPLLLLSLTIRWISREEYTLKEIPVEAQLVDRIGRICHR